MAQLNAYLIVQGNCFEMMNFYKECLGGDLIINKVSESPVAAHMPSEKQNDVLHAMLTSGRVRLMASDNMLTQPVNYGDSIHLCVECESKEEIASLFSKLGEGGKISQPLREEFFGTFGSLTDKYGIPWMFQFGTGEQK